MGGAVDGGPLIVVSTDSHAGAQPQTYREYLPKKWHDEFDAWLAQHEFAWQLFDSQADDRPAGAPDVNWDVAARHAALDRDGVAGEVLFPNSVPPFFPSHSLFGTIPSPQEYARRWAGLQAHNRWLSDFCREGGGRWTGMAQILLNDVDDAVTEVRWADEHGLGGVLIGAVPPGHPHVRQLRDRCYDPLWAECAERGIPVAQHLASGAPEDIDYRDPVAMACVLTEYAFYSSRSFTALTFSGAFERFPGLKFVFAEAGAEWVPTLLAELDGLYAVGKIERGVPTMYMREVAKTVPRRPSEYFLDHCYVASFLRSGELASCVGLSPGNVMWASDFPHEEGSYPNSRDSIRVAAEGLSESDTRAVLGETAIGVFGMDRPALAGFAERIAITSEEARTPLTGTPAGARSTSSAFLPALARSG